MKKIAKIFLSFMIVVMCSFSLVACSGNDNDGKGNGGSSVDGIYYFNREIVAFYENDELTEEYVNGEGYGYYYGTSIEIKNNQFEFESAEFDATYKLVKDGTRYKLDVVDKEEKEDNRVPATTARSYQNINSTSKSDEVSTYSNKEEMFEWYLEVTNDGVNIFVTATQDEMRLDYTMEYVRDSSKVVKYDYRLKSEDIEYKYISDGNGVSSSGQIGSVVSSGDVRYNDFIDVNGSELIRFDEGDEYKYSMTKDGDVYTLTLLTETEYASFETATLEMTETGFVITYSTENIVLATLEYIKL